MVGALSYDDQSSETNRRMTTEITLDQSKHAHEASDT